MWVAQIILMIIGISSGAAIACGLFSFIIGLGIVSKFADKTRTGDKVKCYENAIALGGISGSLVYIYKIPLSWIYYSMPIIGVSAGIFVGCWAMSIAEVINIFPVLIRRIKLLKYIQYVVVSIALGKGFGMWIMFLMK